MSNIGSMEPDDLIEYVESLESQIELANHTIGLNIQERGRLKSQLEANRVPCDHCTRPMLPEYNMGGETDFTVCPACAIEALSETLVSVATHFLENAELLKTIEDEPEYAHCFTPEQWDLIAALMEEQKHSVN